MNYALDCANVAFLKKEVPIGAIITCDNNIIASAHNETITKNDHTAHAELLVIQKVLQKIDKSLMQKLDLYVTLEPCSMCMEIILSTKLRTLVFGAYDSKGGGINYFKKNSNNYSYNIHYTHLQIIGGVFESKSKKILKNFFEYCRSKK